MLNRIVKKVLSALLAGVMVFGGVQITALAETQVTQLNGNIESNRTVIFNDDWKFVKNSPANAETVGYDDSGWQSLDLPHDWRVFEDFSGVGTSSKAGRGYLPYGTAWYRKSFELTPGMKDKQISINFGGVMNRCKLYVNGQPVGVKTTDGFTNIHGYGSFSEDITAYLNQDGKNVIAVMTNVSEPISRWYSGSGIYRDVTLTVTEDVYVPENGTYITMPVTTSANYDDGDITNDFSYPKNDVMAYLATNQSQLDIETEIVNKSGDDAQVVITTDIMDGAATVASVTSDPVTIASGEAGKIKQTAQ
ncbi:MAG: beta galactosidase jelly roll domain-containing protein, partial [Clostridiales bacterium]|nr:beta galactosidase jelly roll domain-containing protein [Clostridiales bacterium]